MVMIECDRCKIQEADLYVEFPEDGNINCEKWEKRSTLINNKYNEFNFCEKCSDLLSKIEEETEIRIMKEFLDLNPNEKLMPYYELFKADPYRTKVKETLYIDEVYEWINNGSPEEYRTYKKCFGQKD